MKNKDTRFFDLINWIFKNSKNLPTDYTPSYFLLNRWISMADVSFAKIVNFTTNKWFKVLPKNDYLIFYHTIFPKFSKRINYIKKTYKEKENEVEDLQNIASIMECSVREIEIYNKTLEELTK